VSSPPARLALDALQVEFGPTRALESVSTTLAAGEIVGLLGHNGAGNSTLFNVVSGVLPATSGAVIIDGMRAPERTNPAEMAKRGVTVIHQEPALAPNLSVIDNLFLGQERLVARGDWMAQARAALDRVGSDVDLSREVGSLGLGERQLVDLARGLVRGELKILMLDEPTAALGRAETIALHSLIRRLAADGVTVVYVSHRLPDILDVCDRILILRAGRLEVDGVASDFDGPSLSRALAPDATFETLEGRAVTEDVSLRLEGTFSEIEACAGEVVGLFGMAAGSKFGLLEGLF
jgi:ABC-type sugar transport system ATPase subunit